MPKPLSLCNKDQSINLCLCLCLSLSLSLSLYIYMHTYRLMIYKYACMCQHMGTCMPTELCFNVRGSCFTKLMSLLLSFLLHTHTHTLVHTYSFCPPPLSLFDWALETNLLPSSHSLACLFLLLASINVRVYNYRLIVQNVCFQSHLRRMYDVIHTDIDQLGGRQKFSSG